VKAGTLNHRVVIEQPVDSQDASGKVTRTWAKVCEVWANVRPVTGSEAFRAQAVSATYSSVVEIRYRSGITPKMRVVYGERTLNIESVENVEEANRQLNLKCTEKVSA
jgi:SPP1 family predicted phage head-tail adaptor